MGVYDEDKEAEEQKQKSSTGDIAKDAGRQIVNHARKAKSTNNDAPGNTNAKTPNTGNTSNPSNAGQTSAAKQAASQTAQAGAQGGSQAAGAAAGEAGAAAGTTAAAAGAGSGAGAGATAGSVVPGIGTAIGATVGKLGGDVAGNAAKREAEKQVGHSLKQQSEEKVKKKSKDKLGKKDTTMNDDDNVITKIICLIVAVAVVITTMIIVVVMTVLLSIGGPVIALFTMGVNGIERCSDFFDRFDGTPSFAEICDAIVSDMKEAFQKAYNETCYQEVYQIAIEQDYNLEKTLESYKDTEFPYNFEGEECNVNFTEIINILTMSEKINFTPDEFEYSEFTELLEDKGFLRTLYDLHVEPVNYLLIGLEEYESGSVDENGLITIINTQTGSVRTYQGVKKVDYDTYGAVSVRTYPIKKVFDYFEIDPYAESVLYPTMNNYDALAIIDQTTRLFDADVFWGTSEKSDMYDYEAYTGDIYYDEINMYMKDYIPYLELSEPGEKMEIPRMVQADERWTTDYDGTPVRMSDGSTIKKAGCCLTCMSMVCTYLTGVEVTPVDLVKGRVVTEGTVNKDMYPPLQRGKVANAYGFKESNNGSPTIKSLELMCSELDKQHPIILKMNTEAGKSIFNRSNSYGTHFVVLTGWSDEEQCFYVNDPAGRVGYFGPESSYQGKIPFDMFAWNFGIFVEWRSYSY